MAKHSSIVGGSTAKRVMNCPGSVRLSQQVPPRPSSVYADEGTLLHEAISHILANDVDPRSVIGMEYAGLTLTDDLFEDKLRPAMLALDQIDPDHDLEFACETVVNFGDLLPGVFGSADLIGRRGNTGVLLDWKFGSGVPVEAEENPQIMFYVAAAMRTPEAKWAFEGVDLIECHIVQPPHVRSWLTTPERIARFEKDLVRAVKKSRRPDAPVVAGEHCRWCPAKPICPQMTGAVERATRATLRDLDPATIGVYLENADLLERWIDELRALAHQMLDGGVPVPGWKLVPKRGRRQWVDEDKAKAALMASGLTEQELTVTELVSPAQAEKALKKRKLALPGDLTISVSSGNTMAREDDPRPAALQIGQQLTKALAKLAQ